MYEVYVYTVPGIFSPLVASTTRRWGVVQTLHMNNRMGLLTRKRRQLLPSTKQRRVVPQFVASNNMCVLLLHRNWRVRCAAHIFRHLLLLRPSLEIEGLWSVSRFREHLSFPVIGDLRLDSPKKQSAASQLPVRCSSIQTRL